MSARYFIGTSGWHYAHWRGLFYPRDLASGEWLKFYVRHFNTVEINSSFYRLPDARTVSAWKSHSPPDFRFAVKASRYITHMKKLSDPVDCLRDFLAMTSGLGVKLGPVLFQLPPGWRCNPLRLDAFLQALPRRVRCAFELRDPSWHNPEIYNLLRRNHAAFCIYDLSGFRAPDEITADFIYVRLHGPVVAYGGRYSRRILSNWAARIHSWQGANEVYVYFNNDESAYAVRNALELRTLLDRRC